MISILGMGCAHPTTKISNQFLEDLDIGTTAQWIEEKIGIIERVTTLPLDYIRATRNEDPRAAREAASADSTDLGVQAAQKALESAGITAEQVGMIICNSCTPSHIMPTEAQRIAKLLDVQVPAYDVFTACPAFALQLDYLSKFEPAELPPFILCVSTATLTQNVDYNDRSDGAIWGDGAAAWVISTKEMGRLKVIHADYNADPTRCGAVLVERYGHFHQDGRAVRDFSVRQTVRLVKKIESDFEIDWLRDIFIGHQANRTMLEQIVNNRGIGIGNHWHNVSHLGNQAGAGAPATLSMHWDQLFTGRKIVVAVVGAGLSWGSSLLEVV